MSEGTREGPQVRHKSGAQENVPGKVHFVVQNVLGSCFPPFLYGQDERPLHHSEIGVDDDVEESVASTTWRALTVECYRWVILHPHTLE